MGISFCEGLGYVAQGAAEGSEEIRKEKLAARMEQMKDDIANSEYLEELTSIHAVLDIVTH